MMQKMQHATLFIVLLIFSIGGVSHAQDTGLAMDSLIVSGDEGSIEDAFAPGQTMKLYAFYAATEDSIHITMTQEDDALDPFIVLLDASGAVLATDDDSGERFLSAEIAGYRIPEDGYYLIMATSILFVEGVEDATDEGMAYTITLTGASEQETDADTAPILLEFEEIEGRTEVEGLSSAENPVALYAFQGIEGEEITLYVESDEFPTAILLFGADGTRLIADPSAITGFSLPEDGVYLVMVVDVFFYESLLEDGFYLGGAFTLMFSS